jgi:hypothetical protein
MAQAPRICFDRVIPSNYHPAGAVAHAAALSNYTAAVRSKAVQKKLPKMSKTVPGQGTFNQNVASIGKLGTLSATDPVAVARMALIDLKKWDN